MLSTLSSKVRDAMNGAVIYMRDICMRGINKAMYTCMIYIYIYIYIYMTPVI